MQSQTRLHVKDSPFALLERLNRLTGELCVEGLINQAPALKRGVIIRANAPNALTNEIQSRCDRFNPNVLDYIRFVDHAGNPMQNRIIELIFTQHGMERTMIAAMRQPHTR